MGLYLTQPITLYTNLKFNLKKNTAIMYEMGMSFLCLYEDMNQKRLNNISLSA